MNATLTPPPVTPAPGPDAPQGPGSGSAGRTISIVAIVVGCLAIVGTAVPAIRGTIVDATRTNETQSLAVGGVTALEVDADAADLTIAFGDVDEATLDVDGTRRPWTLDRDGDTLRVGTGNGGWARWDGGWDGWNRGWGVFAGGGGDERVMLTLPRSLEGLDADLSLDAGELTADGAFGALDLDLGAGSMNVTGSADTLSVDMSAGSADFTLSDVREADLSLAAGRLTGALTGSAPEHVALDVSAGDFELTLPDEVYAVEQDVTAGSLDDRLDHEAGSRHTVSVEVSAGRVVLRSGD